MLSLEKCKQILSKSGKSYSNEDVSTLRDMLYDLGKLEYYLINQDISNNEDCSHLHTSLNRRTGTEGL